MTITRSFAPTAGAPVPRGRPAGRPPAEETTVSSNRTSSVGSLPSTSPTPASRTPARWTGAPDADRRDQRRALLVEAGFALLGTEGLEGTSVRAVCREARLSPRYFYESFADADELLVAVYDAVVADLREAMVAAMAAAAPRPRAQARAVIEATIGFIDADRRRGRVLFVEAQGHDPLNRRRIQTMQGVVDVVGAPAEHVGRIAATMLVGGFNEILTGWLDGRLDVEPDKLVDATAELFLALGQASLRLAARHPEGGGEAGGDPPAG